MPNGCDRQLLPGLAKALRKSMARLSTSDRAPFLAGTRRTYRVSLSSPESRELRRPVTRRFVGGQPARVFGRRRRTCTRAHRVHGTAETQIDSSRSLEENGE